VKIIIGQYVTAHTIHLGVSGLIAGLATGIGWRAAGRARWGAAPFLVAGVAAAALVRRSDWPGWYGMVGAGAVITVLAGAGAAHLLADSVTHWAWVAAGALISAGGVWAGVPETGPAVLAAGGILGLAAAAGLTRARWTSTAGWGVACVLGWAALSGAAGRPWAALGGALCTGVAPWLALASLFSGRRPSRKSGPWLLGAHLALVILAARWIGVDPHAGWIRVGIVAFVGIGVSMSTSRQA
jgi:hypothetical protein